jgi:hypothetical protein
MSRTVIWVILIVLGGGLLAFFLFSWGSGLDFSDAAGIAAEFSVGLAVLVSMLLGALPILVSNVQTTAKERQLEKLESISSHPAANTAYYKIAIATLRSIKPAHVDDPNYIVPILSFSFVIMFACSLVFLGGFPETNRMFERGTFLLGGVYALTGHSATEVAVYQKGTLLVGGVAFLGSYVYMLARLIDRINNNDIYPVTYYYYSVRFATAVVVAMIFRHAANLLSGVISPESAFILIVAFGIGFVPDLFIAAMVRRATEAIKVTGSQNDPEENALPTSLSLLMIEGLSREKIDRLSELGIDNAQVLACQNPFTIWPRLPYSISLIVDWIAQAQLYRFTKEAGTKALRQKGIRTASDLRTALEDEKAAEEIATVAGLLPSAIDTYRKILDSDPTFRNLQEVRATLAEDPHESPAAPHGDPGAELPNVPAIHEARRLEIAHNT